MNVDGLSVSEKSVEVVKKAKKGSSFKPTGLEEVACKIFDALIMEYMPENSAAYIPTLGIFLQSIDDKIVYHLSLNPQNLESLGVTELSTKNLVDICSWLKTYDGTVTIKAPMDSTEITFDMLVDGFLSTNEPLEEDTEIDLLDDATDKIVSKIVTTTKKKFGKKL